LHCVRDKSASNTRKEASLENSLQPGACSALACPTAIGHHLFQTRWAALRRNSSADWAHPCARVQQIGRPTREEGRVVNSYVVSAAAPMRLGIIYAKHDGGSYTNSSGGRAHVRSKSNPTRGRQRRSKVHGSARAQPTRAHCDWGVIYFQTPWSAARATGPDWGAPAHAQIGRPTRGRKVARKFMRLGACSAHNAIGASFISKHDGGSATQKFLWPGVGRSLLPGNKHQASRKGDSAKTHILPGACSAHTRPMRLGVIYFQTRWRQRHRNSSAAGLPTLVCSKSGVQHEEGGSLENSCQNALR
jgi:hypothetical protein